MAQRLVIANYLNGKLLNTVFILSNFTRSISQYCKEYADLHN